MKAIVFFLVTVLLAFVISGCSIIKEGITGERPEAEEDIPEIAEEHPFVPAAFPIIGDWFAVYSGSEYLGFRFTADGKCELQPALYSSDLFGPKYYGDYHWGGAGGNEVIMDMYKGVSKEVDYGDGNIWDEWSDGGRVQATTGLMITFSVYGGNMKSVAMKIESSGNDTDGYTVVKPGAIMILISQGADSMGAYSPFIFGSEPYDDTEGKKKAPAVPDIFISRAERFYTTAELNVRCGPSVNYATYGTVQPGTPVDKIGEFTDIEDWAFVLLDEGGGWVNTDYLSATLAQVAVE